MLSASQQAVKGWQETSPSRSGNPPSLSIVSTNYNCGHALADHLESIYRLFREDEFEYLLVDNMSKDASPTIVARWASYHRNFRWMRKKCTRGRGRELAARHAVGTFLLVVDTDTVYAPILRDFVDRAMSNYPGYAVQAIYAGIFPTVLWRAVGGSGNFNQGEDLEMWMRLLSTGRIRWYPAAMGENIKEPWASDRDDYRSARYPHSEKFRRLCRTEFDSLRLARYERMDLESLRRSNSIDLGLAPTVGSWIGDKRDKTILTRARAFAISAYRILKSSRL
jgi:glycosyltransferase involved in cell wall biosynthesis